MKKRLLIAFAAVVTLYTAACFVRYYRLSPEVQAQTNTFCAANLTCTISAAWTFSSNLTVANLNKTTYWDGSTYLFTTAGLQSALNATCNGTVLGTLILPPQTVTGLGAITLHNNCTVQGNGQFSTNLTFSSGTATNLFTCADTTPTNVTFQDFTIDGGSGTSAAEQGINCSAGGVNNITIQRMTVQNLGAYGINLSGTTATPGDKIKVLNSLINNVGLSGNPLMFGIAAGNNSDVDVNGNELAGTKMRTAINAFSANNANSASASHNVHVNHNRIHDWDSASCAGDPGTGIDVGRAFVAEVIGNSLKGSPCGVGIIFESVWHGVISDNVESLILLTAAQPVCILLKVPDTTQVGEVGNFGDSVSGNSCDGTGGASLINVQSAVDAISITGNAISTNTISGIAGIWLQLTTTDANISTSGWNRAQNIAVTGNTLSNQATLVSNTSQAIQVQQSTTATVPDQIVVANNTARGWNFGVNWTSAAASNGLSHVYIHDNGVESNNNGIGPADAHTYATLYYWNEVQPTGTGPQVMVSAPGNGIDSIVTFPTSITSNGAICSTSNNTNCQEVILPNQHTLTRLTFFLTTAPLTCSTQPVIGIFDLSAGTTQASITIANGAATGLKDSGALSIATVAGHFYGIGLTVASIGCGTNAVVTQAAFNYQ